MKRFIAVLAVVTAVAGSLALAGSATAAECGSHVREGTGTLKLRLTAGSDTYRAGDDAVLHAEVRRYVGDRDVGPADGATVGVQLLARDGGYLAGNATTDAEGKAAVKIRLPRGVSGSVDARAMAWKTAAQHECGWVGEDGRSMLARRIFRIIR